MPLQALADRHVDQSILDGRAPSVGALFRSRVRATPDAAAYLHFADGSSELTTLTWGQTHEIVEQWAARAHQPRGAARGPGRHRLDDPGRVDPRRPRRHVRRGRDDDRLPDDDRRGRRLHPQTTRAAASSSPRTTSRSPSSSSSARRDPRACAGHHADRHAAATTAGSSRPTSSAERGREGSPPTPTSWTRIDQIGPESPRVAHLHLRHDRAPQGRAARRTDSVVYEGAVIDALGILTTDDLQFLWLPLSHVFGKVLVATRPADRLPDGRRRPRRQDRREHGGHQADLHGRVRRASSRRRTGGSR